MKGKGKGSQLERDVAKFLTFWLTGQKRKYYFWRNDASGGLATMHEENVHMTGDIKSIHPDSQFFVDIFSVEIKNGYHITSFWQHFHSYNFGIEEFWIQACNDANKANKHPMLIYRKKGRRLIIGIDKFINNKLKKKLKELNSISILWSKEKKLKECFLYDMENFFKAITPEDIKKLNGV